jgi:hypothetical protein
MKLTHWQAIEGQPRNKWYMQAGFISLLLSLSIRGALDQSSECMCVVYLDGACSMLMRVTLALLTKWKI